MRYGCSECTFRLSDDCDDFLVLLGLHFVGICLAFFTLEIFELDSIVVFDILAAKCSFRAAKCEFEDLEHSFFTLEELPMNFCLNSDHPLGSFWVDFFFREFAASNSRKFDIWNSESSLSPGDFAMIRSSRSQD